MGEEESDVLHEEERCPEPKQSLQHTGSRQSETKWWKERHLKDCLPERMVELDGVGHSARWGINRGELTDRWERTIRFGTGGRSADGSRQRREPTQRTEREFQSREEEEGDRSYRKRTTGNDSVGHVLICSEGRENTRHRLRDSEPFRRHREPIVQRGANYLDISRRKAGSWKHPKETRTKERR